MRPGRFTAVDDFVWAYVNFLNLFEDKPDDTGVAGVDIYRFDNDGKVVEHWVHYSSAAPRKILRRGQTEVAVRQSKRHVLIERLEYDRSKENASRSQFEVGVWRA